MNIKPATLFLEHLTKVISRKAASAMEREQGAARSGCSRSATSRAPRRRTRLHAAAGFRKGLLAVALTLVTLLYALSGATPARAQAGRVYITPDPAASGGISGRVPMALTHAIAVKRDRVSVYLAALSDGGQAFRFEHLPIGKYDLVLVSKTGTVFEGLALGDNGSQLSATQRSNLEKRIDLADSFFKQHTLHRFGVTGLDSGGDAIALAFVERYRGNDVLKQNGEKLNERVRRLEIIELHQATDDWQFISTRHLYREGEPNSANPQFFKHATIPALGNIRVVENAKDLGTLNLTSDTVQNP